MAALAQRNSNAEPTKSAAKTALKPNTFTTPGAQEVTAGGQIMSAITGTSICASAVA